MNHAFKLVISATALSLLAACGNNSSGTDVVSVGKSAEPIASAVVSVATAVNAYRSEPVTAESPTKPRDINLAPVPTNITLGAPQPSQIEAARKSNQATAADQLGKPLQIGFGRDVAQTATASATSQVLKWQATQSGGQVAAINFNSTGAKGMRVGVLVDKLPATATLRFYAKGATTAFEVKGAEVLMVLVANLAAGDKSDAGRTYWGSLVEGADAIIEIELPSGVNPSLVNISFPSISHMFMSAKDASSVITSSTYNGNTGSAVDNRPNTAETCHIDVSCTAPLPAASDSVAWIVFQKYNPNKLPVAGYDWYQCSGTLLNDNISSGNPYVLTANHCISSQTVASTVYSEWKYRSDACNATTGTYFPTTTTGASLLYTAFGSDSTLLKLYGVPTAGVLFSGWDAAPPTLTTAVTNIHHPDGVAQRMTTGSIYNYIVRNTTTGNVTTSTTTPEAGSNMLGVTQLTGTTEGGSSGSGLFAGTNANPKLIGQLLGRYVGAFPIDSCEDIGVKRIFGRFDVAFNAGMKDWLVQGVKSVSLFNNASTGVYYYTYSTTDISTLSSNVAYSNQGAYFNVSSHQTAGLSPVHRFYNTSNGSYFYTISEKERAAVASNTPRMRYDGIVWYASATSAGANTRAVYSYFNSVTGSQFFTTSSTTAGTLIAGNSQFKADGIAFYVTP